VVAAFALAVPVGWAVLRALRVEELAAAEDLVRSALRRLRGA
jgi:hypothetical protein